MEPAAKRARMDPGGAPPALSGGAGGIMDAPGGATNIEGASVTLNVMSDLVGKVRERAPRRARRAARPVRAHPGVCGAPVRRAARAARVARRAGALSSGAPRPALP